MAWRRTLRMGLALCALSAAAPAAASNLTWGELREAMGPRLGRGETLDDPVPRCGDLSRRYRPDEPSLCVTQSNCSRMACNLLFELDEAVTDRPTTEFPPLYSERPTQAAIWGWGILSVGIISLSGVFGGLLWPVLNSRYYSVVMRYLIGLAAGSLTATSIFQLIPESLNLTDPGNQSHLDTAVIMWFSIWFLYFGETACKIFFSSSRPGKESVPSVENGTIGLKEISVKSNIDVHLPEIDGLLRNSETSNHVNSKGPSQPQSRGHGHSHGPSAAGTAGSSLAAVAWMVILGDGLHNFVDGMSIGAGYSQSIGTGVSISLAIACEEFPHELGDFAILINSGVSFKRALVLNFASACTAFGGLALGILLGEVQYSYLIFAFAGGLFMYIALGSLTPELKAMIEEQLKTKGRSSSARCLCLQLLGVSTGATALYLITRYNDSIRV